MDRKRALAVSAAIAMGVVGVASAFAGVAVRSGSTSDIAASLSGNNREPVVVEITEYVNAEPAAPANQDPAITSESALVDSLAATATSAIQDSLSALTKSGTSAVQSVVNSVNSSLGRYVDDDDDDDDEDEDDNDEDDEDDEGDDD